MVAINQPFAEEVKGVKGLYLIRSKRFDVTEVTEKTGLGKFSTPDWILQSLAANRNVLDLFISAKDLKQDLEFISTRLNAEFASFSRYSPHYSNVLTHLGSSVESVELIEKRLRAGDDLADLIINYGKSVEIGYGAETKKRNKLSPYR